MTDIYVYRFMRRGPAGKNILSERRATLETIKGKGEAVMESQIVGSVPCTAGVTRITAMACDSSARAYGWMDASVDIRRAAGSAAVRSPEP